jgi:hypothetical protein
VSPSGSDSGPGSQAAPWRTLQRAVDQAQPGYVIEVLDGVYPISTEIHITRSGTSAAPIVIRSSTGGAIIDGTAMTGAFGSRDALYLDGVSHVVMHGLTVRFGARSGARISLSDHVSVQGCRFLDNGTWGVFTDYTDDLLLQGNECARSGREHGIYHSNSGDRVTIRGNFCHDNFASGIQLNADPALPGDGITSFARVEGNICARNGAGGGAAINLASVRDSVIATNLLYDNLASGIAMWDDGFDPAFGCKDNVIAHNTVVFRAGEGRYCVALKNGSTGNRFENNLFVGGRRGVYDYTQDSLVGLAADRNLLVSLGGWPLAVDDATGASSGLAGWRTLSGGDLGSIQAAPAFADPAGFDYSLAPGSPGRDQGSAALAGSAGLVTDLYGAPRPAGAARDMGALER